MEIVKFKEYYNTFYEKLSDFSEYETKFEFEKNKKLKSIYEIRMYEIITDTIQIIKSDNEIHDLFFGEKSTEYRDSVILEDFRKLRYFKKDLSGFLDKIKQKISEN